MPDGRISGDGVGSCAVDTEGVAPISAARSGALQWRADEAAGEGAEENFASMWGTDVPTYHRERPGMSAFVLDNGVVCHIYFTYARAEWTRSGVCTRGSTAPPLSADARYG